MFWDGVGICPWVLNCLLDFETGPSASGKNNFLKAFPVGHGIGYGIYLVILPH